MKSIFIIDYCLSKLINHLVCKMSVLKNDNEMKSSQNLDPSSNCLFGPIKLKDIHFSII